MKSEVVHLYEENEKKDVTLTTYVLEDSPELLAGKSRPAILICPGGAYLSCSDREGEPVAMKFASMGYHAFVLRYSVYLKKDEAFPDLSKPVPVRDHCLYPAPMRDIAKAMLIIRAHAADWHVDTTRIAVCGFSAGAHNAAMYAANWQSDLISNYFQEEKEAFRPAAAILGYPLSDYIAMNALHASAPSFESAFFALSNTAFLGSPQPSEALLDAASPARHVTASMPPTFLWATSEDAMVPVSQSLTLARSLADAQIPFELHVFENGPHGLSLATQASVQAASQIYPDAAKWADLADAWLQKRFALPLPDEMPAFGGAPEGVL